MSQQNPQMAATAGQPSTSGYYATGPNAYPQQPQQVAGVQIGQPAQQIFTQPGIETPPPASTIQAMQQQGQWVPVHQTQAEYQSMPINNAQVVQQPKQSPPMRTLTPEQFQAEVDQAAESKFKERVHDIKSDVTSFVEGKVRAMGLFSNGNQNGNQQNNNQNNDFWNSGMGDAAKVGIGAGIGFGLTKLIGTFFGSKGGGNMPQPSGEEFKAAEEALKVLFHK